jgi:NADH-quinone oxidoreductase subunit C
MAWAEEVAAALDPLGEVAYDEGFGPLTATVPAERWVEALTAARDTLGCAFFDWLSAVDELEAGFALVCHLARHRPGDVRHLLLRTTVPRERPVVASAVGVYAGAAWHERETTEMFGLAFGSNGPEGDQPLEVRHLLLPEEFEGFPLRKEFVLASRVAKPWPGAKEPGESDEHGPPSRRRTRPPGVPEPEAWGPRDPGSPPPEPLAHARPGAARPRRRTPADRDVPDVPRRRAGRERPPRPDQRSEQASDEGSDQGRDEADG